MDNNVVHKERTPRTSIVDPKSPLDPLSLEVLAHCWRQWWNTLGSSHSISSQPRHASPGLLLLEKFQDTIYPIMYNLSLYIYSPCTIYSTQTHPRTSHPGLLLAPLGMPMSSMHSRKMHICITLFDLMCSTFSFKNEKICLPNWTQICPLEGSSGKKFYP